MRRATERRRAGAPSAVSSDVWPLPRAWRSGVGLTHVPRRAGRGRARRSGALSAPCAITSPSPGSSSTPSPSSCTSSRSTASSSTYAAPSDVLRARGGRRRQSCAAAGSASPPAGEATGAARRPSGRGPRACIGSPPPAPFGGCASGASRSAGVRPNDSAADTSTAGGDARAVGARDAAATRARATRPTNCLGVAGTTSASKSSNGHREFARDVARGRPTPMRLTSRSLPPRRGLRPHDGGEGRRKARSE